MTREEVINMARAALEEATRSETSVCYLTSEDKEWLEVAIKALEQESIIDKIRAEVMALRNIRAEEFDIDSDVFDDRVILRSGVLDIIDRYRTEREVRE